MFNIFKEGPKSRIGLDISPEGITLAHIKEENGIISIEDCLCETFKKENPDNISEIIKNLVSEHKITTTSTAISVPSNLVFIKRITLPDLPYEELKTIAPQEATKYLPLTIRELNVDFQILENTRKQDEGGRTVDVVICAIAKAIAKDLVDPIFEAGLGVDAMDISSFAALRTLAHEGLINDPKETYISVLVEHENTDIQVVQHGMPVFSYNVQIGKKTLIESIGNCIYKNKQEVLDILPDVALVMPGMEVSENQELNQAASAAKNIYNSICSEIQKTLEFFNSGQPEPVNIAKIIISGSGACIQNIDEYVHNKLKIETITFNPVFSTSIGLALKGLEN